MGWRAGGKSAYKGIVKRDLGGDEIVLYLIDGGYMNLHMDKIA